MSMTPAQYADWKARMDAALVAYADAASDKATLHDSPDATTALAYAASSAGANSAVAVAAAAIEALQAEFVAAATPMDVASPTVVSTYPIEGHDSIPVSVGTTGVLIEFSEELDPATVLTANIFLTNNAGGASGMTQTGNPSISPDGKTVTITHTTDFAAATQYKIKVTKDVKDVFGNFMEYDYVWTLVFETL